MVRCSTFYRPRKHQDSPFFKLVSEHFDSFQEQYPSLFEKTHGFWRPCIRYSIDKFLKCGDLKQGFARIRCPDCNHEMFVAFSCKQKTCPSCAQKRCLVLGQKLIEDVLSDCAHTQWVFTIPKRLRIFFRHNRKLLGKLAKAAYEAVSESILQKKDVNKANPGAVVVVQSFGDIINFHPHIHMLLSDSLYDCDGECVNYKIRYRKLMALWQDKVFKLLKETDKIDTETIEGMKTWRHSGFSIDSSVKIKQGDKEGLARLIQYMTRCPFSLARMIKLGPDGTVIYRAQKHKAIKFPALMNPDLFAGIKRNYEAFTPLEFLAEVTQHIPDKNEHQIRYYGYYSNKARGMRKNKELNQKASVKNPVDVQSISNQSQSNNVAVGTSAFRLTWALLIQMIYEVNPLECPKCHGSMEVIGFIKKEDAIKKILEHCELWEDTPARDPPPKTKLKTGSKADVPNEPN